MGDEVYHGKKRRPEKHLRSLGGVFANAVVIVFRLNIAFHTRPVLGKVLHNYHCVPASLKCRLSFSSYCDSGTGNHKCFSYKLTLSPFPRSTGTV